MKEKIMFLTNLLPKISFLLLWVLLSMLGMANIARSAPVFQATGAAVNGQLSVSPVWPTHAVGDVALLFVESAGGEAATLSTTAGFAAVANSPQATGATTNGTRITVFWARATTTTMASPTVADPGNHVYAQIITYRGVINTGNPWDVTGGGVKATASTTVTVTGVTTTVPDTLIVQVVSRHDDRTGAEFSAQTNASLTGIAERADGGTTSGNGGGFAVWDGVKATAGATGNTTAKISKSVTNAFLTIALRPAAVDHIEIDYPAPPFSTCAPTTVTVYSCANAACTSYYTGGASVTLSPGGNVVVIPAGSGSASGTVFQSTAGTATLNAVAVPAASGTPTTTCKNTTTGTFSCSVTFSSAALSVVAPDLTAGNTVAGSISGCKAQVPVGNNTINFYTAYSNPASGTRQATINATTIGASAATSTGIILNFTSLSATANQATFNLSYPDVGLVNLNACMPNCTTPNALGSNPFTAAPHRFSLSNIICGNGSTFVGCIVTSPYANPGAANAAGAAFMKAGNPFSMTVTAYNSANVATPNFGKETTPESVSLTSAMIADVDLTFAGILTGTFGTFSNGVASGNAFSFDEVGIMTLTARLASGSYLGSGLKEITTPSSGNIGRFTPDHFTVNPDALNPIRARAGLTQTTALASVTVAPATVINVASTAGFYVGSKVRIPGAGVAGNALTATVTAVNAAGFTLTLDTAISTTLIGGESVVEEWGSYMGEKMNAQFDISATDIGDVVTQNYQGAYAKLNPAAAGNPLRFGAVNAGVDLTLRLVTSLTASGGFSAGIATVIAPLMVTRGASADGPYTALQLGIAPTTAEADGIRMGAYDLNVGGTNDRTSIMDPLVQNVTAVLYGRTKIANAYGSELLPLSVALSTQYWNGLAYVTSVSDNLTTMVNTDILLNNYLKNLTPGSTTVSPLSFAFRSGASKITLSAPGIGKNGSVDMSIPVLTGASCAVVSIPLGCYLPSITARATFGVYKGANEFIYLRENY